MAFAQVSTTWISQSKTATQLFQDFYYGRYTSSTPTAVIYNDPARDYKYYNFEGVYNCVRYLKGRSDFMRMYGVGMSSQTSVVAISLTEEYFLSAPAHCPLTLLSLFQSKD